MLQNIDQAVCKNRVAGETTCAVAVVVRAGVYGASVGDSGVWVINESGFINLTERQLRKPFIGSGSAWPCHFEHQINEGDSLLLATDGFFKYTGPERIVAVCRSVAPLDVPGKLVELVRYPSGALPDDVTLIFAYEPK